MEKKKIFKILVVISLIISVFEVIVGFANFSTALNINKTKSTKESRNSNEVEENEEKESENSNEVERTNYVYTISRESTKIDKAIPKEIVQYETANEARANFENRQIYLKHKVKNEIVEKSYIEFIVTEEMVAANPGMKAGTYTLEGGDNGTYDINKKTLKTAFGESNCEQGNMVLGCHASGLCANVNIYNDVSARDNAWNCRVTFNGYSQCTELTSMETHC